MRLLILSNVRVIHTLRWVEYFRGRGHELRLASVEPPVGMPPEEFRRLAGLTAGPACGRYLSALPALRKLVREFRPELVNAHYLPGYGLLAALDPRARPLAVSAWGSDLLLNPWRSPLHAARTRLVLGRAALVTCDGRVLREILQERFGVEPGRILDVPLGIDPGRFHPAENLPSGPPRIVSTRRLEPLYDLRTLLHAAAALRGQGKNFALELVGTGGERPRLEALARELGLAGRVRFHGELEPERLAEVLRQGTVYVSTARSDSTSVSLLEALASGVFPVVTGIPGNREWIAEGVNGLTFPPGDWRALADALSRALAEPSLRIEAARHNQGLVRERALWSANMRAVEEAFLRLTARQSRAGLGLNQLDPAFRALVRNPQLCCYFFDGHYFSSSVTRRSKSLCGAKLAGH